MSKKLQPEHLRAWRAVLTANARIIQKIDTDLRDAGQIPLKSYDALIELYEAPNQSLRMSDLADKVLLTKSGLSRLVDRLEKDGLLKRDLDPEDRRSFYASITEQGIEAMRQAWSVYASGIQALFARHLSDEEAKLVADIFSRIERNIDEDV